MNNKINIKSLVLGAALGAAFLFSLGAATEGKKPEYRQVPIQQSDESLNKLADEGWSVVCTGTSRNGGFYVLTQSVNWEYKTISVYNSPDAELNKVATDGWTVVSFSQVENRYTFLFKRKKQAA